MQSSTHNNTGDARRAAAMISRAIRSWRQRIKQVARRRIIAFLCSSLRWQRIRRQFTRRAAASTLFVTMAMSFQRHALYHWRAQVEDARCRCQQQRGRAASVLQRLFRVMLTAFRLMRRRDAATRLQSVFRGHLVRLELHRQHCESLHHAVVCVQRHMRGFLARRRVHRLVLQLRDRFRCANCGLVEPGGRYCKLCGRRRTVSDTLGALSISVSDTTDAKLRLRRVRRTIEDPPPLALPLLPPPPAHPIPQSIPSPTITNMLLPPVHDRGATHQPHKPTGSPRSRLQVRHRSFSSADAGSAAAHNTRRRAERLLEQKAQHIAESAAMRAHMRRLEAAAKAASR